MKHFRLWAICLALTPLAACPVPAPAQAPPNAPSPAAPALTGLVTHISIVGLKNISLGTVQAKMTLKVGDAYTPEAAQKDIDALKSMGVFQATMSVKAALISTGGIDLTYTVAENPVVQSINFTTNAPTGKPSVPFAEMSPLMKTRVGQVLNTNILSKDIDTLFGHPNGYVEKQGHFMDVSSDIDIDPATGVLTIPLLEYQIKSITVAGNNRVKTADILTQMHIKIGDLFSDTDFDKDLASIYETGKFRAVNYTRTTNGNQMDIALSVVEQAPATGVLDEKPGKVIPFLYDPITMPTPLIQVSINGKPPLPCIVDTGCTAGLLLNLWAAQKLGLHLSGADEKADNYIYKRTTVQDVVLAGSGSEANADFGTQPAQVADLGVLDQISSSQHIAGIIGLGLLAPITSRFDFAAKTLTLFTTPHPPLHAPDGIVLPMRGGDTFTVRATLAPGTYADLVVDTGSGSTQIPVSVLKSLHPTALTYSGLAQVDGDYVVPELRLPKMDFGTLHMSDVVVTAKPPPIGPALGMNILAGYCLILDGPNGQLILEPSLRSQGYTMGRSGLDIKRFGKRWIVIRLKATLPAQNAGIQVGDELVTIGGASVTGLRLEHVGKELAGIVGTPVQVSVRRRNKLLAFTWIPVDDFHISPSVIDGMTMRKVPKGVAWVVEDILPGCPGSLAGLQEGDEITRINGIPVTYKPTESSEEAEEPRSALFEIERSGVVQPFTVRLTAPK